MIANSRGCSKSAPPTRRVQQIADQVKALPESERAEFLSWVADYELEHSDAWDEQIARDSQPGGRLSKLLNRVKADIAAGRTKPLDEAGVAAHSSHAKEFSR